MSLKCLIVLSFFYVFDIQAQTDSRSNLTIYGFIKMDAGYNFKTIDPNYYDVMRTSKLPSYKGEYAPDGKIYYSVRATQFGVKSSTPTKFGDLNTYFEFELFGSGEDVGQTAFRLRKAYGELGKFGAGQYWSVFMDSDIYPNILDKFGPPGMLWYRNIQIRYTPITGDSRLTFGLERPGFSADGGVFTERIELSEVKPQYYLPDFTGNFRYGSKWGYVQLAGLVKFIKWVPNIDTSFSVGGNAFCWGGGLTSTIKINENNDLLLSGFYGKGIGNYVNDSPADIGAELDLSNINQPVKGIPLPVTGLIAFLNHRWSSYFTSSAGYSMLKVENSNALPLTAFNRGQYAVANLIYYPANNFMTGIEYQWAERKNNSGFISTDTKIQFSVKVNFQKLFSWD